jgi:hypothetical protein
MVSSFLASIRILAVNPASVLLTHQDSAGMKSVIPHRSTRKGEVAVTTEHGFHNDSILRKTPASAVVFAHFTDIVSCALLFSTE